MPRPAEINKAPLAEQVDVDLLLFFRVHGPPVDEDLANVAGEIGLIIGRETADPYTLRPAILEGGHHLPRAARLHVRDIEADAHLIIVPPAVAGGKNARVGVVLVARHGVGEHGKHRSRHLLLRQVGKLQPRGRFLRKTQGRLAVQGTGHIVRAMLWLLLPGTFRFCRSCPSRRRRFRPHPSRSLPRRPRRATRSILSAAAETGRPTPRGRRACRPGPRCWWRAPVPRQQAQSSSAECRTARLNRNCGAVRGVNPQAENGMPPLAGPCVLLDLRPVRHRVRDAGRSAVGEAVPTAERRGGRAGVLQRDLHPVRLVPQVPVGAERCGVAHRMPRRNVQRLLVIADPRGARRAGGGRAIAGLGERHDPTGARPLVDLAIEQRR